MSKTSTAKDTPTPQRVLILQLARTSDLLQSLMALRAAKQLYPVMQITLVVRERFAAAARRLPWIHQVIELPSEALLGTVLQGRKTESQALGELSRWATPLLEQHWDFAFNWTFSEASSFLAALIPARVKLGFSRRPDQTQSAVDGWSHYIQAIVQGGVRQNIHLTDILTTQLLTALQLHLGDPAEAGDAPVSSKGFFQLEATLGALGIPSKDFSRKWVAIQLGAGLEKKTWSPLNWSEFAIYLLERHPETQILLLGTKEEETRAAEFLAHSEGMVDPTRILNLVGKTDFDNWAAVIGRCQWLIAGDTAAVHLASILGTRVLNLSIGTSRGNETGPYGNGHYVILPAEACAACQEGNEKTHSCGDAISPESLYAAWCYASNEWSHRRQTPLEQQFERLGFASELPLIQLMRSRIRSTEQGGGVVYDPLIQRPLSMDEWLAQVVGHVARAWYCGWTPPIGQELERSRISPALIRALREVDEASGVLAKICEEAKRTAQVIHTRSARLKSDKLMPLRERDELRQLGRKLMELEELIERLSQTQVPLRGFSMMTKVLMHNLRGEQLHELGRESAESYAQLAHGVSIVRDWIKHTLELVRPMSLEKAAVIPLNRNSQEGLIP